MRVLRVYDDRRQLYRVVDWIKIVDNNTIVEYCTYENMERIRFKISKGEKRAERLCNWVLESGNEYYVIIDTYWSHQLMSKVGIIFINNELILPSGLIEQLKDKKVKRISAYTVYGSADDATKLASSLKGIDDLADKVSTEVIEIAIFQPEEVLKILKGLVGD